MLSLRSLATDLCEACSAPVREPGLNQTFGAARDNITRDSAAKASAAPDFHPSTPGFA